MGAWTSTFTIGISNREVSALPTVKGYIPINLLLREEDSNLRPSGYEPDELPLLLSRDMYSVRDSNPYYIRERDVT